MNVSIQTKLLGLCIVLVLITTIGISGAYYVLTSREIQRDSQQQIRIAFDIIFKEQNDRLNNYGKQFEEFLHRNTSVNWVASTYKDDPTQLNSPQFALFYLVPLAKDFKNLGGYVSLLNRIALYTYDKRLLFMFHRDEQGEGVGGYVLTASGADTYASFDDSAKISEMMVNDASFPEQPLPSGAVPVFQGELPDTTVIGVSRNGQNLSFWVVVPLYEKDQQLGVLVGEAEYTQSIMDGYAALSRTEVNLFAGNQWYLGTLPAQNTLEPAMLEQSASCQELLMSDHAITITAMRFAAQRYYQGRCALHDFQGQTVGAFTVSLSQQIGQQEVKKILTVVLVISGIVTGIAFGGAVLLSRNTVRAIHSLVNIISATAEGDLRWKAVATTHDEVGMLATKLNQMGGQLRSLSGQIRHASSTVNGSADMIRQQMEILIQHLEQQSASVDHTTVSIEKIQQFIDAVAQNTDDLLAAASQIFASIQETRASVAEVTNSTGALTTNLHLISSSVEQVNHVVTQISENTGQLEDVARQTEIETQRIDDLLRDVSATADHTRQIAKGTMDAATGGQLSVEASIQGMTELKAVVSHTAQIMQNVNTWGERVSSILGIVDDITEQTSLLALNAAIISAQAGDRGRGFAVVADEIKELATRTKSSTQEIGNLVYELQKSTEEGVKHTVDGIAKADQGMHLAHAVQDALTTILERATQSSTRAADIAQVIQQTATSSQIISASMSRVTEMVSNTRKAIREQEQDIEQVVAAVENLSGMSEQVNRASVEQKHAANQIAESMENAITKFSDISAQTGELKRSADQIVSAMHTIESATENIFQNATEMSQETVKNLVSQADVLQQIVNVFKVS